MSDEEKNEEENILDTTRRVIANAPETIEEEFNRTINSWLACFISSVEVVDTYLSSSRIRKFLSAADYKQAQDRIEKLKEELIGLRQQYPDRKTVPSEEVQTKLLQELDVFRL